MKLTSQREEVINQYIKSDNLEKRINSHEYSISDVNQHDYLFDKCDIKEGMTYYLVTENNAGQYYPDYAYNHPLFTANNKIYSDSTVSKFISEISVEDSVAFQNEWNANKKKTDRIYISYDSTNKNCQAGEIDLAEFGHAKDDKGLPIVNYSIAYDCKNREPLFYEDYPGSIVDVSQLQCMLDKAKSYVLQ